MLKRLERSRDQGPAYTSKKGRIWISWSGEMYSFLIAFGRVSFSIDAKADKS